VVIHPASERIDIGNLLKGPAQKAMLRERPVKPYPLTARQRQVLNGLAGGQTLAGIAYQIGISPHSVHHHVDALKRRFRAVSLSQLVSRAIASGLELSTPPQGGPGAGQVSE
jgi:DNA-binding CsgD family transcriptional regulator